MKETWVAVAMCLWIPVLLIVFRVIDWLFDD